MRTVWITFLFLYLIMKVTVTAPVSNTTQCESLDMKCKTGECIPNESICDGILDCLEGEDERNCTIPMNEKCSPGHSPCSDEEYCVPNIFLCDGERDCFDGSDEANCEAHQLKYSCSSSDSFVCKTKKKNEQKRCLPQNATCNGIKECPLGDDEDNCEDVRRCAIQEHKCQHFCEDRPGSFVCGCAEGYKLEPDGRSCRFENEESKAGYLLAGNSPEVHQYPLANLHDEKNYTLAYHSKNLWFRSMDYMRQNNETFLMVVNRNTKRFQGELTVLSNGRMKTLRENIFACVFIAVDWIGKNVFFTQDHRSSSPGISVCTMNGLFCRRIIEGKSEHERYLGLAVHPMRGLIFWIDHMHNIMMSKMDGSDVRILMESERSGDEHLFLFFLAIDPVKNDVYFSDSGNKLVERINIDNKEKHVVFSHNHTHIFNMLYFNGFLYFPEWDRRSLMVREVAHNHSTPHVIQKYKTIPSTGIALNHSLLQIEPSSNPCKELDCPWLCIVVPKSNSEITAKCICPDGYTPSNDTCIPPSPLTELAIFQNYSRIGFELMSDYCKTGVACKNGGACRELLNEKGEANRIICDCKPPYDGLYCERINPEMHSAMINFKTQFTVLSLFFICILVLLIVGCGALIMFSIRKLKAVSSNSVNFVKGEKIIMEDLPTSFNNPSFDDALNVSSASTPPSSASFSTTIRIDNDGSLL